MKSKREEKEGMDGKKREWEMMIMTVNVLEAIRVVVILIASAN